jgi:hypothetical protein
MRTKFTSWHAAQLLLISQASFAAQQSRHSSGLHSRAAAVKGEGAIFPSNPSRVPPFDYRRGTLRYPFGPGCYLSYPDRMASRSRLAQRMEDKSGFHN